MKSLTDLLQHGQHFWLFENTLSQDEPGWLFTQPLKEITAYHPHELEGVLHAIDKERQRGHYLAGFINYEAGYALHKPLRKLTQQPTTDTPPLLRFYVFDQAQRLSKQHIDQALEQLPASDPWVKKWHYSETKSDYLKKLARIHQYIEAGDSYQVNHTLRIGLELEGSINSLYRTLRQRQPVGYSALIRTPQQTILSLSPELFISKRTTTLQTKPMKGTAKRASSPLEDAAIVDAMRQDNKLKAENLMIVDLMRNDIGYLAKPGSVKVRNLFEIQTYETLHQMISTVEGEVDKDISFAKVIRGLFPCGSITGAPKIRTMEIIHELESTPRDLYTGALGFISPDNDFTFNVPIRTLRFPEGGQYGILGVGGGIIYDSKPEEEWQECLLKTRFLTGLNQQVKLIETFRYEANAKKIKRLESHLERLTQSAGELAFPLDETRLRQALDIYIAEQTSGHDLKIRLLLDSTGQWSLSSEALSTAETQLNAQPTISLPSVTVCDQVIDANNFFRRHKTTNRALYNQAFQQAEQQGHYDVLFLNQMGYLAEASRHNLLIKKDGRLYTPPASDGALPGIMRQTLLKDITLPLVEISLTIDDLKTAEQIYLCNSVRGIIQVVMAL